MCIRVRGLYQVKGRRQKKAVFIHHARWSPSGPAARGSRRASPRRRCCCWRPAGPPRRHGRAQGRRQARPAEGSALAGQYPLLPFICQSTRGDHYSFFSSPALRLRPGRPISGSGPAARLRPISGSGPAPARLRPGGLAPARLRLGAGPLARRACVTKIDTVASETLQSQARKIECHQREKGCA